MHRTRTVIAVALVATALCADRAVAAAPVQPPRSASTSVAGRLVSTLSERFQRVVPSVRLYEQRCDGASIAIVSFTPVEAALPIHPPMTPFQHRLPPPQL
jgi:hypothetical protein